jgi:hypothetical protein
LYLHKKHVNIYFLVFGKLYFLSIQYGMLAPWPTLLRLQLRTCIHRRSILEFLNVNINNPYRRSRLPVGGSWTNRLRGRRPAFRAAKGRRASGRGRPNPPQQIQNTRTSTILSWRFFTLRQAIQFTWVLRLINFEERFLYLLRYLEGSIQSAR